MNTIILISQIVVSVLLVVFILLQSSSAGLGGAFGSSDSNENVKHTRRGVELWLFNGTIVLSVIFVALSLYAFLAQ